MDNDFPTGKPLEGDDLERASEMLEAIPSYLANSMYISMCEIEFPDGSTQDAVTLTFELLGGKLVQFGLKPDGLAQMVEGFQGALVAYRKKTGQVNN